MLHARTCAPFATVHQDGADLAVAIKVLYTLPVHPQDALDVGDRHGLPGCLMVGVFDQDLAGAAARYSVEDAEALALDVAFDLEEGGTLWDDADEPF
jgi:hypothetical protein